MPIKIPFSFLFSALLIFFIIINPIASLDLAAFLLIFFFIIQKLAGDYTLLFLLAARPSIDYWRETVLTDVYGVNINLNAAFSLLLAVYGAYFLIKNKEYLKKIPAIIPWILFLSWSSFTFIYSFDKPATVTEIIRTLDLFILFMAGYVLKNKNKDFLRRTLPVLVASSLLPFLLAVYQLATGQGMTIDDVFNRIYGTFAHPNVLASYTLLLIIIFSDYLLTKKDLHKKYHDHLTAGIIFLFFILLSTYTRMGWLALAVFTIPVLLKYEKKWLIYGGLGIVIFYSLFFPINSLLRDKTQIDLQDNQLVARLTSRNTDADSIEWRTTLYERVLPIYYERPILGYGYGSFVKVWNQSKDIFNLWDNTSEAHNDYLKIVFETGVIGLIFYLSIFVALLYHQIKYGIKHKWTNIVFIAGIVAYMIFSVSDNMLRHTPTLWWMWFYWGMWSEGKS